MIIMIGYADFAGVLSQFFLPIYRDKRPKLKYVGTSCLYEGVSYFFHLIGFIFAFLFHPDIRALFHSFSGSQVSS